jgi:DNA polymerase-3 subunit epsilon
VTPALNLPLAEALFVFLDLETTGLGVAAGHRICEVAMLRERAGAEEARLETLVAPGRPLDPRAAAVNGLRDDELAVAPPFAAVAPAAAALLDGAVLVGHNLPFDLAFLRAEFGTVGMTLSTRPCLDTLALARRLLQRSSYSLGALAAALALPTPSHRAMADVVATRGLFHYLRAMMAELDVMTLGDALRFERGVLPGTLEPEAPALIVRALAEGLALRIVYRSRSAPEATERTVRPIALTRERSGVYLRAFCELRQDVRAFAIAKIEAIEIG